MTKTYTVVLGDGTRITECEEFEDGRYAVYGNPDEGVYEGEDITVIPEPEVRTISVEPHPDFSLAFRIIEAIEEYGYKVVKPIEFPIQPSLNPQYEELAMLDALYPVMGAIRKYGPDYRAKMERESK